MNERGLSNKELAIVIVCLVVIGAVVASLIGWLRAPARIGYKRGIPAAQQQMLALLMYSGDNNDSLPPSGTWMDAAMPYLKNRLMFKDPMLKGSKQDEFGYAFFAPLSLVKTSQVGNPDEVPLTFPSIDKRWNANGDLSLFRRPLGNNKSSHVSFLGGVTKPVGSTWPERQIVVVLREIGEQLP